MDRGLVVVLGGVDTVDNCLWPAHGAVPGCGPSVDGTWTASGCLWVNFTCHQALRAVHRFYTPCAHACPQEIPC